MVDLIHAHWFPLASQGNIYSLTSLKSVKGANKILVASLKRQIFSFEYDQHSKWRLKPQVKELLFTYIPNGAEITAIDAYNKSNSADEFVIGISIMKTHAENSIERYLNIYTEGVGEGEDSNSLESIAQNCLMVELSYTPYFLYHTIISHTSSNENSYVWLISGNDYKIHMIKEDKQNHSYTESSLEKYFPELDQINAIALWIDIYYYEDFKWRLTAVSCECGLFKLSKVSLEKQEIIQSWSLRYDNPVCKVQIFPSTYEVVTPSFLNINLQSDKKTEPRLNVLLTSDNMAVIFQDILNQQLNSDLILSGNDVTTDIIMCSCIADINMDGKNEVLLGTYKHEVLIFALINDSFEMIDKKHFDAPVYSLSYLDLAGDGVKVLVVLTQRSVHIMQHNPAETMKKWIERFTKLKSLLSLDDNQLTDQKM